MVSRNPIAEQTKNTFKRGINTITGLYSCTIIDVHPEKLTVDVTLVCSSKTICGVSLVSDFIGEDCASITIPERFTEAIIASTEDHTSPFIVAYKPMSSHQNTGYFNQELQEGEAQKSFKSQSFTKNDAFGGMYMSSGASDWVMTSNFNIYDESTKRIISALESIEMDVIEYPQKTKVYTKEEVVSDDTLVDKIVADTKDLVSATIEKSNTSIYGMLEKIQENNVDLTLIKNIRDKIDDFLGEELAKSKLAITQDKVEIDTKNLFLNNKDIHVMFQGFTSSKIVTETTTRIVDSKVRNVTATHETISEDNETICIFSTFSFGDDANYIEEELALKSGKKYLRKTWLNHSIDNVSYDMYSEVTEIIEEDK